MELHSEKETRMNRSGRILTIVLSLIMITIVGLALYRIYIQRDYWLKSEVVCDPENELCFVRECVEDCESIPEPDYYKIQHVKAKFVPVCDPHTAQCPELDCGVTPTCTEVFCDDTNVPEEEGCNDPGEYSETLVAPAMDDASTEDVNDIGETE